MIVRERPEYTSPITRRMEATINAPSISHSGLEVFGQSPLLFYGIYIAKTIPRPPSTPQMVLGSAFHSLVLEPHRNLVRLAPKCDQRTTAGKETWAAFQAGLGREHIPLTQEQYDTANRMAESVLAHPMAKAILDEDGEIEAKLEGTDKTSLNLNGRLDKLTGNIVELKTASDPSPESFAKSIVNYGYGRQAAMYLHLCDLNNKDVAHVYHIVVGSTPPYETVVYELEPEAIVLGQSQMRRRLEELCWRIETNDWFRWQREIVTLQLPRWAYAR